MNETRVFPARLADSAASCEDGRVLAFGDALQEAALAGRAPTRAPREDLAVVAVAGVDARDFLHAQVAANLKPLQPGQSVLTAWCSPKGRVLFLITVIASGAGEFRLLLARDQAAALAKRLRMFVLRAAVTVDELGDHGVISLDDCGVPPSLPDDVLAGAETAGRTWLTGPASSLAACWDALPGTPIGELAASLVDIRRQRPRLTAELGDQFLPQELDLDEHAGVSFDKGCYPGQEIIARVRFRGSVKRRLAHMVFDGTVPPPPGARLVAGGTETARGTVLLAAQRDATHGELLCVRDLEAADVRLADRPAVTLERVDHGDGPDA